MKTINDWYKDGPTPLVRTSHWIAIIFCVLVLQLAGNAGQLSRSPVQFSASQVTDVIPMTGAPATIPPPVSTASISSSFSDQSLLWSSGNQELKLYSSGGAAGNRVCPVMRDREQQPFCREFNSRVIGVCGQADELLIVLASGDVHRLNYALMRPNGSIEPTYAQPDSLSLVEAWMPASSCTRSAGLPEIYAMNSEQRVMHFSQHSWRQLKQ